MHGRAVCFKILVLSVILCIAYSGAPRAAVVGPVSENSGTVAMHDVYELKFNLDIDPGINPFRADPSPLSLTNPDGSKWGTPGGADVWAQVTTPSGKRVKVYGFWDTDYLYLGRSAKYGTDRFIPASAPHWKVRYAPQELGRHRVALYADGRPAPRELSFSCVPGEGEGFVRLSGDGTRFVRGNGRPYIAFMGKALEPKDLAASGINTVRTWITNSRNTEVFREVEPERWILTGAEYYAGAARSGVRSVRMSGGGSSLSMEKVPVRSGSHYRASAWISTGADFPGAAAVQARVWYSDGSSETFAGSPVGANSSWTESVLNFTAGAPGKDAELADFTVSILSGGGTARVDDAGLFECNPDGSIKVGANYLWQPDLEEWNPSRLRLSAMWRLDERFKEYRKMGITQQLCIFDYKLWDPNPRGWYSRFFGDTWWQAGSASGEQQDMALRYLVARFAHYTSLFAFELTNEMDPNWSRERESWIRAKAEYIRSVDPYGHIITNSYWNSPASVQYEQMKCLDVRGEHFYMVDEAKSSRVPVWGGIADGASIDSDTQNARSGKRSLKLSGGRQSGTCWIKPSQDYVFRFYAKGGSVTGRVRECNQAGKQLSSNEASCGGASYALQSLKFRSGPAAASVSVEFSAPGTAWVDDVELVEGGRNVLYNGGFEASRLGDDEFEWAACNSFTCRRIAECGPDGEARPWVGGEFGLMGKNWDWSGWINPKSGNARHDTGGLHIHNALWASFMSNSGTHTPGYWWTAYVDNYNLWHVWKGITRFSKSLPFYSTGKTISTDPVTGDVAASSSNPALRVLGQKQGNSAYLWVQNSGNTWARVVKEGISPVPASGEISIPGFAPGSYKVDWYDTATGTAVSSRRVNAVSGRVALEVNALAGDTAAVIIPDLR